MTPKANASGERGGAAQPAASSARASAASRLVVVKRLEPVDRLQRVLRRERVGIDLGERLAKGRGICGRRRHDIEKVPGRAARAQLPLELGEVAARGAHD